MGVHVVSKLDNRQHASFNLEAAAQSELAESSVRIRPLLLSLTSNNLTYALLGEILHWWDAYPVSANYPAPYNDPTKWGIVPAWGYATIEESTIPDLAKGTLLYGFWPTSDVPTDLKLTRGSPEAHWIEINPHRQQLMPLYNRYTIAPSSNSIADLKLDSMSESARDELDRMAWTALFIGGVAGYLLAEYVFPADAEAQKPIHPLGDQAGLPWSRSDADLSSAVVVNLAASTKTARVFTYFLSRRQVKPLGLMQVTSSIERAAEADRNLGSEVPSIAVRYGDIGSTESAEWLAARKAEKVVIVDFGGRDNAVEDVLALIKGDARLQHCEVVIVQVGNEQKVYSMQEVIAGRAAMEKLGKVQFNTSGVQDTILASGDVEGYFKRRSARWEKWLDERHLSVPGMEIVFGKGVLSAGGIEGGWEKLCNGQVAPEEGLVYKMQ